MGVTAAWTYEGFIRIHVNVLKVNPGSKSYTQGIGFVEVNYHTWAPATIRHLEMNPEFQEIGRPGRSPAQQVLGTSIYLRVENFVEGELYIG